MIRRKSVHFSKKSVRTHSSATAPSFFRLAHPLHLFPKFPKRPTKMRAGRKGGFRGEFRPALHLVFAFRLFRAIFSFLLFCSATRARSQVLAWWLDLRPRLLRLRSVRLSRRWAPRAGKIKRRHFMASFNFAAPRPGLEPGTSSLTARRSTN